MLQTSETLHFQQIIKQDNRTNMSIQIYGNKIVFGQYQLEVDPEGLSAKDGYGGFVPFTAQEYFFAYTGYQGSSFAFSAGGGNGPIIYATIDRFPFATNTNATSQGVISVGRGVGASHSSGSHGYCAGGSPMTNVIDKYPFVSPLIIGTDVGDLTQSRYGVAGQQSPTHGYSTGGYYSPRFTPVPLANRIDKFPFAADTNATTVGALISRRFGVCGQTSTTDGYTSGGSTSPDRLDGIVGTIDKFPTATDANATNVGGLTQGRRWPGGQSSTTSGYTSGGVNAGGVGVNIIDNFPFATNANASDVGDLTQARVAPAAQSSTTHGYTSGGYPGPVNIIDRFPFASNANATDVGDLAVIRNSAMGSQY